MAPSGLAAASFAARAKREPRVGPGRHGAVDELVEAEVDDGDDLVGRAVPTRGELDVAGATSSASRRRRSAGMGPTPSAAAARSPASGTSGTRSGSGK